MARTTYHHGRLREALISHGVRLVAKRGVAGLSLRELARAAGVSPAAPYRHFRSAAALAEAIAAQGFEELRTAMLAALADPKLATATPLERLGRGYLNFALRHPDHFQLMFSGQVDPDAAAADSPLHAAGQEALAALTDTIAAGQAQGYVSRDVVPAMLAVVAWSFIHGFASLSLAGCLDPAELGLPGTRSDLADAAQALLRRGWGGSDTKSTRAR